MRACPRRAEYRAVVWANQIICHACIMNGGFGHPGRMYQLALGVDADMHLGLVTLAFRSLNSFMQPFVGKPKDFCHLAMSAAVVDYKTH